MLRSKLSANFVHKKYISESATVNQKKSLKLSYYFLVFAVKHDLETTEFPHKYSWSVKFGFFSFKNDSDR